MLNIREHNGKLQTLCLIRKRWIKLQPEEWVRQNLLKFIIEELKIPAVRIGVEVPLKFNTLRKRADIVVWDKQTNPLWIIECKEEKTLLSQVVINQLLVYYAALPVPYLSVSNGKETFTWNKTPNGWELLNNWPVI